MSWPATQTFWLEETDRARVYLRRYAERGEVDPHYHQASEHIQTIELQLTEAGTYPAVLPDVDHTDPRWPSTCQGGDGYLFQPDDMWQVNQVRLYARADGMLMTLRDAPPGAMWNASWMSGVRPDGIYLMVRLPNGDDWAVDSQASNCTRKGEPHECWVRHGDPRQADITVDKNGDTCTAGAGSILAGDYHGFLRGGLLVEA